MSRDAQSYTRFFIIRHGKSEGNIRNILQGQKDFPLSAEGEVEAIMRARHLQDVSIDHVFSSDLLRARKTAEIIAAEKALAVSVTHALRERCFGEYDGSHEDAFSEEARIAFDRWLSMTDAEWMRHRIHPQAETGEEIVSRFLTFIREIAIAYPGKTILAVSHGDMMRTILVHLGFAVRRELPRGAIQNTGYFVLDADGVDFFIRETHGINKSPLRSA